MTLECAFMWHASISPQSTALQGASGDHFGYRQNTVTFMRQHRDDFEPFMEDGEDFERYCSRMAQVVSSLFLLILRWACYMQKTLPGPC